MRRKRHKISDNNMNFLYDIVIILWVFALAVAIWYGIFKIDAAKEASTQHTNIKLTSLKQDFGKSIFVTPKLVKVALKNSNSTISVEERETICYIVAGECGYESFEGKMAVAQCIYNAMKQDGLTASQVRDVYQYAGWKTNLANESPEDWVEVEYAVKLVFDYGEKVTEENILWFYAPKYSSGSWHNTQKFVVEISNHRFYAPWD